MTLKKRIIYSVLICFLAVWLPSIFILFSYMNRLVFEESEKVARTQMAGEVEAVNDELESLVEAIAWISGEESVSGAVSFGDIKDEGAPLAVLEAQNSIDTYMIASPVWNHLNKIVVFSPDSTLSFEYVKWRNGDMSDRERILSSDDFLSLSFPEGAVVRLMLSRTVNAPYETAVVAYGRVSGTDAYVYAELSADIFQGIFSTIGNAYIVSGSSSYPEEIPSSFLDESAWSCTEYELAIPECRVVHFIDRSPLRFASSYGLAVFIPILIASAVLFVLLSILLSRYLTAAASRLVGYIEHLMAEKNFGAVDKSIEEGCDEIASVGRTINAMSVSIAALLRSNEELFEEKKRMELDILQMQVNPHFLYNTLESMHYLADIQKNDGIARMSRGLSTLLRNMAKGTSDKIKLSEELSLLRDYDDVQQVRYMGMYELVFSVPDELQEYLIQKFTLQPLVENAIFHGIEPSGRFGTVEISAEMDGGDLVITVEDDGVGMSDEEIEHAFDEKRHSKTDMTGVGTRNINDRIRLMYGQGYGLSFESVKGEYTKAVVRIKAEKYVQDTDC